MGVESTRRIHDIKKRIAGMLPEEYAGKWEAHIRKKTLEKGRYTPLNDMVSYHIDQEFPEDVAVHVHENLTKNSISANRLMVEGLQQLARRLKSPECEQELGHIKRVAGYSWIVYNSPDILRMLGFEISNVDHEKHTALATMDRDKFVRKFGA